MPTAKTTTGKFQKFINRAAIFFMNLLRNGHGFVFALKPSLISTHYENNVKAWKKYLSKHKSKHFLYIEDQENLEEFQYGKDGGKFIDKHLFHGETLNASHNSCEVIAVYNALQHLHQGKSPMDFPSLLMDFETQGIVLSGNFGTSPKAIYNYFKSQSTRYAVTYVPANKLYKHPELYQQLSDFHAVILTAWNTAGVITDGIHTVCITKDVIKKGNKKMDIYHIHNSNQENQDFESLADAISGFYGGPESPITIIGVSLL